LNKIKIECAFDKMVPISELKPNPRNCNHHSEEQIRILAKVIKDRGWRVPITISKRSGFIVRGHARLLAAKLLKLEEVPCDIQSYISDEEELEDLVGDNRISELAELSIPDVREILKTLDAAHRDLELTGFAGDDLLRIMDNLNLGQTFDDDKKFQSKESDHHKLIKCPNCGEKFEFRK